MAHSLVTANVGMQELPSHAENSVRPGLMRELVCAALRHQADLGGMDEAAGMPAGWLSDALLRPLLLCAVKCASSAPSLAQKLLCACSVLELQASQRRTWQEVCSQRR